MPGADPTTAAAAAATGGGASVEAVLFDFTGVVTTSPFDALADFERRSDIAPGALLRALLGDYAGDGDHPWHRIERGEMAFSDYAAALPALCAAEGIDLDAAAIFGAFGGLVVHEPVVEAVRALRTRGSAPPSSPTTCGSTPRSGGTWWRSTSSSTRSSSRGRWA